MFSQEPNNKFPIVRAFNGDESFKPREVLLKYLYHWPLFVIALGLTLTIAFVYLKITKPVYEITASLLIKEDNINNSSSKTGIALAELDITSPNKIVDNEIEVLKSRTLMTTLVSDLQLWVDYQSNKKIGKENLFGVNPVKIIFSRKYDKIEGKSIIVYIKNNKTLFITEKDGEAKEYLFDTSISNGLGTFKIEKTKFYRNYIGKSLIISFKDFEKTVSAYQKGIEIALVNKKTPTVSLTLTDAAKERGKAILNHLITIYNIATIAEKNRITKSTMDFIDSRLVSISKELSDVEGESEQFKSSRGLTDITSESRMYLENVQSNDIKLNDVKVRLNVVEGIEDYINSSAVNKKAPSTLGIDDPGLNSLIAKLNQLEIEKTRLLATTPESNPIFVPLNSQIETLKGAVKINIANVKLTLENSKDKLESFDRAIKSSIKKIPGEERAYIAIKRQENVKQDLFLYLLKKKEEISLSYASTLADARVIDSAYAGPVKWPNKILILAIALIAGFGLPIALLIARSLFNDKVKGKRSIENEINTPVLMDINEVAATHPLIIFDKYQIAAVEQFRFLRTKVLALHNKTERGRITLITSSVAEEGKGFIAANLALTLASSGRKTILVDVDIRKNNIAKLFNLANQDNGLINYLESNVSKNAIIKNSELHFNLDIITSGEMASTLHTELLEKVELEILINWLKQNYDDIILYTPPVKLIADALILTKFSTVILFVVRSNFTKKSYLKFIDSIQKNNDFNKVSVVLNASKPEEGINEYGQSYYPGGKLKPKLGVKANFKSFLKRF